MVVAVLLSLAVQHVSSQPSVLRVRGLDVVDGNGRVLMQMKIDPDGPVLELHDAASSSKVEIKTLYFSAPANAPLATVACSGC
jgi:hypothetical protein